MQLIILSFMYSQLYNPLTNLSNLKWSFSTHLFRTSMFSNYLSITETRLKFWILICLLSNSLLGSNFYITLYFTGGMVRWLKKSSKDVNNTWQHMHLKSRWLKIRTIHYSFIFTSKYRSRVFLPKWLTFFSSKKPKWLKIRREIEFEAKWFEFWATSVFSS